MKKFIKKALPSGFTLYLSFFKSKFSLVMQYFYDYRVYSSYNAHQTNLCASQLEGKIIAHYHVIEKGISHPTPKKCFSLPVVNNLIKLINAYDSQNPIRTYQIDVAVDVLKTYSKFPTNIDCLSSELVMKIDSLKRGEESNPGAMYFTKSVFFNESNASFNKFALSRYSVRDFTNANVELDILMEAIKIAQKTPSVCNRQTAKVHILTKKDDIANHLSLQTGNRGFGHKINKLIIITSDMHFFEGHKERNQAFTDGGMFAMSLLYALHNCKLGAITLNWAYDKDQDAALHNLGTIPSNEKVILFIGVGHVPNTFRVAASERRMLNEIVRVT